MVRPNLDDYSATQLISGIPKILTNPELTRHESQAFEDLFIKLRKVIATSEAKAVIESIRRPPVASSE